MGKSVCAVPVERETRRERCVEICVNFAKNAGERWDLMLEKVIGVDKEVEEDDVERCRRIGERGRDKTWPV